MIIINIFFVITKIILERISNKFLWFYVRYNDFYFIYYFLTFLSKYKNKSVINIKYIL